MSSAVHLWQSEQLLLQLRKLLHNTAFLHNTTQIQNDDTTSQELEATMTEAQKDSEHPEIEDLELVETPPMTPTKEHDKK